MKQVITGRDDIFGPWMMRLLKGKWVPGRGSTIGLWDEENGPVASCLYEASNGVSIMLHIAAVGKRWMNREYLWFVFYYPFVQLDLKKIICPVESSNGVCLRFIEHIGFILEATLKNAAPKGDLLIYTMTKDQCKWLHLREQYRGKTKSSASS